MDCTSNLRICQYFPLIFYWQEVTFRRTPNEKQRGGTNSALFSDEEKEFYQKETSPDKRALPLCLREGIAAFVIAPQIALPAFLMTEERETRGFLGYTFALYIGST